MPATAAPAGIGRYIPILGWLSNYQARWLRRDLSMPVTDDYPVGEKNQFKGTINSAPIISRRGNPHNTWREN
jgi:hypothetical protein